MNKKSNITRNSILIACISIFYNNIQIYSQQFSNIVYAKANERNLLLDIYMPTTLEKPYLIVWIHGGAWSAGSKEKPPLEFLKEGYALASIDYRLSKEAIFPAQIHDIKASIRYLRANANKFGFKKDKIIIWGSSAGGHLAALTGLSNGNKELEGSLGDFKNESSDINLIIDYFGPSNFNTILSQSTPHGLSVRVPALKLLLGNTLENAQTLALQASPVFHVDANDPPTFISHGNQDIQVPVNQSLELFSKLQENQVPTEIEIIQEQGHGGPKFSAPILVKKVVNFIAKNL